MGADGVELISFYGQRLMGMSCGQNNDQPPLLPKCMSSTHHRVFPQNPDSQTIIYRDSNSGAFVLKDSRFTTQPPCRIKLVDLLQQLGEMSF